MDAKQEKTVSRKSLPYFEKEVYCPVCEKPSVHQYLRDRSYIVLEREPDFYISRYQWVNPRHNRFNIYYFHIWHCPHCHYTDERQTFLKKEFREGLGLFGTLKKVFLSRARGDVTLQRLLKFVEYPPTNLLSVIQLHILALYIQHLPPEHSRNEEKIARLFLRTAWLYRMAENKVEIKGIEEALKEFFKRQERLQGHYLNALHDLEEMNNWVEDQVHQEINHRGQAFWQLFKGEMNQLYKKALEQMDHFFALLQDYYAIGETCKARLSQLEQNSLDKPFFTFKSYRDYLKMIASGWPALPADERKAIQGAIHYFRRVADLRTFDQSPLKMLGLLGLLSYLYEKIGDYYFALKYNEILLSQANKLLVDITQRIQSFRKLKGSEDTVKELTVRERKIRQIIQDHTPRRQKLASRKWEVDEERAREIFNRNREVPPDKLEALMMEEHIEPEIIQTYVSERKKERKKGIFQLFRL